MLSSMQTSHADPAPQFRVLPSPLFGHSWLWTTVVHGYFGMWVNGSGNLACYGDVALWHRTAKPSDTGAPLLGLSVASSEFSCRVGRCSCWRCCRSSGWCSRGSRAWLRKVTRSEGSEPTNCAAWNRFRPMQHRPLQKRRNKGSAKGTPSPSIFLKSTQSASVVCHEALTGVKLNDFQTVEIIWLARLLVVMVCPTATPESEPAASAGAFAWQAVGSHRKV